MFDLILTVMCDNATLWSDLPLLERELKIHSLSNYPPWSCFGFRQSYAIDTGWAKAASVLERTALKMRVKREFWLWLYMFLQRGLCWCNFVFLFYFNRFDFASDSW